jgi:NAD(P)-dependent dehydrogenase (short-subunit alcohol dehydrogenase family)
MAKSYAQAGASKIAIGARSSLDSAKNDILAAAKKAGRSPPQILCVKFDITSTPSVSDAAKSVEKAFGNLDILVINAGILGKLALIADSDPDEWWEVWNINLRGPYLVTRAFLPLLLKGGDKTIIATTSVGAHLTGPAGSAYQPSKLAVLRLMEFVQVEYAEQGVMAFAIHPGNVVTDIVGGAEGVEGMGLRKGE